MVSFTGVFSALQANDSTSVFFIDLRKNRTDLFAHAGYSRAFAQLEPRISIGLGLNRTISQQRFFPRLTFGVAYDLLEKRRSFLGPDLHCSVSTLRINKDSGKNHYWLEYMGGIRFVTAGKVRFMSGLALGWISESLHSQHEESLIRVGTWGYDVSIGIGYAL